MSAVLTHPEITPQRPLQLALGVTARGRPRASLTGPSVPAPVGELAGDRFGHGTPAVEVGPGLDELLAQDIDELLQVHGGSIVVRAVPRAVVRGIDAEQFGRIYRISPVVGPSRGQSSGADGAQDGELRDC